MQNKPAVELDDLYQDIILDHFRNPRHACRLSEEEALVDEENPSCGDQIRLTLHLEGDVVRDIRYEAHGCVISVASASMMSEALTGRTTADARRMIQDFVGLMTDKKPLTSDLDDLAALEGVRHYPVRIKCATMSWHALEHALDKLAGR
jgi:nitrogen fixation NifU-like protein